MGVGLPVVTLLIALLRGVFCPTWDVTLPRRIEAVSGSCVIVPCRFEIPKYEQANIMNCSDGGVWRKGDLAGPVVFTARSPYTNIIQGSTVGDLTKKNCTTMFSSFPKNYSDLYFFRLECLNHVKYTFNKGVIIDVRPDPPPPRLIFESPVSEGTPVTLQCSVPVPCAVLPPTITWLPRDNTMQEQTQMQQSENEQMMMTSRLTFIASADHHNQSVSCSVSFPLTKGGSSRPSAATQRLNVLYAPRVTVATLSPSVPVSEGRSVIFTCRSDANPPVSRYTWYRADNGTWTKTGDGEVLVLQVSQDDSGVYLCEAQTQRGSQRSRPVVLEVGATPGSSECVLVVPYIICGLLLILYMLTLVVDVYKYQSLSRRLKQIEVKGEHTYANLTTCTVASDYDRLQPRQPNLAPPSDYENPIALKKQPSPKRT